MAFTQSSQIRFDKSMSSPLLSTSAESSESGSLTNSNRDHVSKVHSTPSAKMVVGGAGASGGGATRKRPLDALQLFTTGAPSQRTKLATISSTSCVSGSGVGALEFNIFDDGAPSPLPLPFDGQSRTRRLLSSTLNESGLAHDLTDKCNLDQSSTMGDCSSSLFPSSETTLPPVPSSQATSQQSHSVYQSFTPTKQQQLAACSTSKLGSPELNQLLYPTLPTVSATSGTVSGREAYAALNFALSPLKQRNSPAKKRLFSSSIGGGGGGGSANASAHRGWSAVRRSLPLKRCDPATRLNSDTWTVVYDLLTDADLVTCTAVNKKWRRAVFDDTRASWRLDLYRQRRMRDKENKRLRCLKELVKEGEKDDGKPPSPRTQRFLTYFEIAPKLSATQSLGKCPRCNEITIVDGDIGYCQDPYQKCGYIECRLCHSFSVSGPEHFVDRCRPIKLVTPQSAPGSPEYHSSFLDGGRNISAAAPNRHSIDLSAESSGYGTDSYQHRHSSNSNFSAANLSDMVPLTEITNHMPKAPPPFNTNQLLIGRNHNNNNANVQNNRHSLGGLRNISNNFNEASRRSVPNIASSTAAGQTRRSSVVPMIVEISASSTMPDEPDSPPRMSPKRVSKAEMKKRLRRLCRI